MIITYYYAFFGFLFSEWALEHLQTTSPHKQLAERLLYSSVSKVEIRMGGAGVGKNVRELAERVVLVSEEV